MDTTHTQKKSPRDGSPASLSVRRPTCERVLLGIINPPWLWCSYKTRICPLSNVNTYSEAQSCGLFSVCFCLEKKTESNKRGRRKDRDASIFEGMCPGAWDKIHMEPPRPCEGFAQCRHGPSNLFVIIFALFLCPFINQLIFKSMAICFVGRWYRKTGWKAC